jgi:hypothetical protein
MPRPIPKLASANLSSVRSGQMSHPNSFVPFGGRGRDLAAVRRVHGRIGSITGRDGFLRFWSQLMMRKCGSAHAVAMRFDVTEQTGRNWIDGFSCPTGLAVFQAQELWPDEFPAAGQGAA